MYNEGNKKQNKLVILHINKVKIIMVKSIKNLVVLDFSIDGLNDRVWEWEKTSQIFSPENCARRIWIGFEGDFDSFPYDTNPKDFKELQGKEAYAHLLEFYSCVTEKGGIDTHNRAQFMTRWNALPDDIRVKFDTLMSFLAADFGVLNKRLLAKYQNPRPEIVARDLSELSKNDNVLIVGSLNPKGNLSGITLSAINAVENKQRDNKSRIITITHPDPEVLEKIKEAVGRAKTQKPSKIHTDIQFEDFKDLSVSMGLHERIFVTLPMGSDEEAEQEIINCWNSDVRDVQTLTHFQGEVSKMGRSSETWTALANHERVILPEDIHKEVSARTERNAKMLEHVKAAFGHCADLRLRGMVPRADRLRDADPNLFDI